MDSQATSGGSQLVIPVPIPLPDDDGDPSRVLAALFDPSYWPEHSAPSQPKVTTPDTPSTSLPEPPGVQPSTTLAIHKCAAAIDPVPTAPPASGTTTQHKATADASSSEPSSASSSPPDGASSSPAAQSTEDKNPNASGQEPQTGHPAGNTGLHPANEAEGQPVAKPQAEPRSSNSGANDSANGLLQHDGEQSTLPCTPVVQGQAQTGVPVAAMSSSGSNDAPPAADAPAAPMVSPRRHQPVVIAHQAVVKELRKAGLQSALTPKVSAAPAGTPAAAPSPARSIAAVLVEVLPESCGEARAKRAVACSLLLAAAPNLPRQAHRLGPLELALRKRGLVRDQAHLRGLLVAHPGVFRVYEEGSETIVQLACQQLLQLQASAHHAAAPTQVPLDEAPPAAATAPALARPLQPEPPTAALPLSAQVPAARRQEPLAAATKPAQPSPAQPLAQQPAARRQEPAAAAPKPAQLRQAQTIPRQPAAPPPAQAPAQPPLQAPAARRHEPAAAEAPAGLSLVPATELPQWPPAAQLPYTPGRDITHQTFCAITAAWPGRSTDAFLWRVAARNLQSQLYGQHTNAMSLARLYDLVCHTAQANPCFRELALELSSAAIYSERCNRLLRRLQQPGSLGAFEAIQVVSGGAPGVTVVRLRMDAVAAAAAAGVRAAAEAAWPSVAADTPVGRCRALLRACAERLAREPVHPTHQGYHWLLLADLAADPRVTAVAAAAVAPVPQAGNGTGTLQVQLQLNALTGAGPSATAGAAAVNGSSGVVDARRLGMLLVTQDFRSYLTAWNDSARGPMAGLRLANLLLDGPIGRSSTGGSSSSGSAAAAAAAAPAPAPAPAQAQDPAGRALAGPPPPPPPPPSHAQPPPAPQAVPVPAFGASTGAVSAVTLAAVSSKATTAREASAAASGPCSPPLPTSPVRDVPKAAVPKAAVSAVAAAAAAAAAAPAAPLATGDTGANGQAASTSIVQGQKGDSGKGEPIARPAAAAHKAQTAAASVQRSGNAPAAAPKAAPGNAAASAPSSSSSSGPPSRTSGSGAADGVRAVSRPGQHAAAAHSPAGAPAVARQQPLLPLPAVQQALISVPCDMTHMAMLQHCYSCLRIGLAVKAAGGKPALVVLYAPAAAFGPADGDGAASIAPLRASWPATAYVLDTAGENGRGVVMLETLRSLLEHPSIEKVTHGSQQVVSALQAVLGPKSQIGPLLDTMVPLGMVLVALGGEPLAPRPSSSSSDAASSGGSSSLAVASTMSSINAQVADLKARLAMAAAGLWPEPTRGEVVAALSSKHWDWLMARLQAESGRDSSTNLVRPLGEGQVAAAAQAAQHLPELWQLLCDALPAAALAGCRLVPKAPAAAALAAPPQLVFGSFL